MRFSHHLYSKHLLKSSLAITITGVLLTGCNANNGSSFSADLPPVSMQAVSQPAVARILDTNVMDLWDQEFDHHQPGLLSNVADAITVLAGQGQLDNADLDKLSYYLRIFSSFGPDKEWPENTAKSVNRALLSVQAMPGFYQVNKTTARLHENYAVALYRLYFLEPLQGANAEHVKPLSRLINLYASADLPQDKAIDYALWEVLRAGAILPYEAKRKNKDEYTAAVQGEGELQQALVNFLTASNATRNGDDWPLQHAGWALAQFYNLHDKQYWNEYYKRSEDEQKELDDGKISLPFEQVKKDLDNTLWAALSKGDRTQVQVKTLFSVPYVVNTFRGKSECGEGTLKDRCISPTIEQALPIKKVCSDSLYIMAQSMTDEQLNKSCERLTSQEATFHKKLNTNHKPVANDFNDKLRVVVFDDQGQYNKYGQLVFDIHTDNGGMYIEDAPQDPNNVATFYSYEHFWVRPEFKVWNLNHEYVHYLDGRFVKYDGFGHFPSHLVWWSEGLAEYIANGDNEVRSLKLLGESDKKDWPTLAEVFATEYKDGTQRVYRWGYLGVRYMYEKQRDVYHQLANYLTTDFFDGYKKLLDETGEKNQAEFETWLTDLKATVPTDKSQTDKRAPRQFYRYSYRQYLKPAHLTEDSLHMHWQYWHANNLKTKVGKQRVGGNR